MRDIVISAHVLAITALKKKFLVMDKEAGTTAALDIKQSIPVNEKNEYCLLANEERSKKSEAISEQDVVLATNGPFGFIMNKVQGKNVRNQKAL